MRKRNTAPRKVRIEVYERRYVGYPALWQAYIVARNHHALLMLPVEESEDAARALAVAHAEAQGWEVVK